MELSERFIQKLEEEGFDHVYEWQDAPHAVHIEHSHPGRTAVIVTDGSITFTLKGEEKLLMPSQRLDIPAGALHSAKVGSVGVIYIVGEMVRTDH
jgi:quercetin dioxygenase-like cupin family protein